MSEGNDRLLWALRILVAAAIGMGIILALVPAAGHDQLWFLLMAQRWLHGATLYGPEIFDSNLPTVVWLSAVPVAIAEHAGVSVTAVAKLLVVLLEAGVAGFCRRIVRRFLPELGRVQRLFLLFAFVVVYTAAPARDFGQRDQLAGLLCLPYVLLAGLQADGAEAGLAMRFAAAVLAGAGVCLKPQQALVPVAVEVFAAVAAWRRGRGVRIRMEAGLLVLVGLAFVAAVRVFAPLFFSSALPTVLASYWAIGHLNAAQLLGEAVELHVLALAAVALFAWLGRASAGRMQSRLRRFALVLLMAGAGATAAYYAQGTGWYYQQLPGIALFGLALAVELVMLSQAHPVRVSRWAVGATAGVAVLALGLTWWASGYPFSLRGPNEDQAYGITSADTAMFAGIAPGTPVAILTTSVDDAMMPVARYRLVWAQRTNNLWLLPAIFRAETPEAGGARIHVPKRLTPARLGELEAQQRRWMDEDFARWKPRVVLVERCDLPQVHCQELEDRHDDLLGFFRADPRFAAAWGEYRLVRRDGAYDEYVR